MGGGCCKASIITTVMCQKQLHPKYTNWQITTHRRFHKLNNFRRSGFCVCLYHPQCREYELRTLSLFRLIISKWFWLRSATPLKAVKIVTSIIDTKKKHGGCVERFLWRGSHKSQSTSFILKGNLFNVFQMILIFPPFHGTKINHLLLNEDSKYHSLMFYLVSTVPHLSPNYTASQRLLQWNIARDTIHAHKKEKKLTPAKSFSKVYAVHNNEILSLFHRRFAEEE